MMTKRLILIIVLVLPLILACNRKDDDNLPLRLGDLKVLVRLNDQFQVLGSSAAVKITIWDATQKNIVREAILPTPNDQIYSQEFKDIGAAINGYYLALQTYKNDDSDRSCNLMYGIFVQENRVTTTTLYTLKVYSDTTLVCTP